MDRELRVEPCPNPFHRRKNLAQTLEREELALQRHEHRVARRHGVDGEEVERRRAVDEDIAVGGLARLHRQRRHRLAQPEIPVRRAGDLQLDAKQIERRRHDVETRHRRLDRGLRERSFADQHVIGRNRVRVALDAEAGRGVALRIDVDDQHRLVDRRERRAEVDRRRGLPHPALLVGDRKDPRSLRKRIGEIHGRAFGLTIADGEHATARIRRAWQVYHIEVEGLRCRLALLHIILALQEQHDACPRARKARRAAARSASGASARAEIDIRSALPSSAHALRSARWRRVAFAPVSRIAARRNAAFLAFDFDQREVPTPGGPCSAIADDQPRKTCAASEIDPFAKIGGAC